MTFQTPSQFQNTARLIRSVAATSDAKGGITFSLGPAEAGLVYEGSVQVPNAPSGALFVATILGANWGQFAGPVNFGPIQMYGGEVLQVVGTGLTPSTGFVLTLFGISMPEELATPIPPAAPMSVVSVETATKLVNGKSLPAGASQTIITPPSLTRRLTIEFKGSVNDFDMQSITVVGTTTGIVYFNEMANNSQAISIPEVQYTAIEPSVDASYAINVIGQNPLTLWVVASTTNPLILGEANSPIPILQPVQVEGVPSGTPSTPVPVYPPTGNNTVELTLVSAQSAVLIPAASGSLVNYLGLVSFFMTGGACRVQLKDNASGNIILDLFVDSTTPPVLLKYKTIGSIQATNVAGTTNGSTVVIATTWGSDLA